MVNWSGIKTNPNPMGTSTGLNSTMSFNDTTANWPDMSNWELRITAGTGVGQVRTILMNSPITITITTVWDIVPDDTSEYELVLVFRNQDHIVGNLTLGDGIITELEDSAMILIDGLYYIYFVNSVKCNWNKSKSTLVTFQPNLISVQGKAGFWSYINFRTSVSNPINFSYIKIVGARYGLIICTSVGAGDFSNIHHIWMKNVDTQIILRGYATETQNTKMVYLLYEGGYDTVKILFNNYANTDYEEEYDRIWIENCKESGITWASLKSPKKQIVRNAVFKRSYSSCDTNIRGDVDKRIFLIDSYFSTDKTSAYLAKGINADTNGKTFISRNVSNMSQEISNSYAHQMSITSRFNDYFANVAKHHYAFYITGATEVTSNNDFICGRLRADPKNIDVSEATSSTENPQQYIGLTSARTNAKSTLNKLLEIDNIQLTNLNGNSVDISFDCKNSHIGTIVDQDSNSGQKVLYITDTSDFEDREVVEIGFGTERQEEGIIDTIQSGISITLKENLTYTHTSIQTDTVKKQLRHFGLPFVKYGITSGEYDIKTYLPPSNKWGRIYCGFQNDFNGRTYEWKKWGHSIKLDRLTGGTTYYAKICAYTPLGDLMESTEFNFTTTASTDYTDPLVDNVRDGTSYKFGGDNKTGILDLPPIADVRDGVKYDNDTKEGISDHALEKDVRTGVKYDNLTKTGKLEVSGVTEESIYNYFTDLNREDPFKADLTGLESDITDLEALLTRCLGLAQENFRVFSQTYDGDNNLLTGAIKIYNNKSDCNNDVNPLATYSITATYNVNGTLSTYKVVKN